MECSPIYSVGSSPQLNSVENFRLSSNSPGINVGDNNQHDALNGKGGVIKIKDMFGNDVPLGSGVDIGMEEQD